MKTNPFIDKLRSDYRYRSFLFVIPGLGFSMIYAFFNAGIGIYSKSAWYYSLAVYYFLISIMRYGALRLERKTSKSEITGELKIREWKAYKHCGIMFIFLHIAMVGAVIMLITEDRGKSYPGFIIYGVATYTFYKVIKSVFSMIKAGKSKAPILVVIKNIGCADALVSLLSLQIALLTMFGDGEKLFITIMNSCTGVAVCLIILVMGIYMIRRKVYDTDIGSRR